MFNFHSYRTQHAMYAACMRGEGRGDTVIRSIIHELLHLTLVTKQSSFGKPQEQSINRTCRVLNWITWPAVEAEDSGGKLPPG
jgi:hypothetical protein